MTQDRIGEQEIQPRIATIRHLEEIQVGGATRINHEVIGAIARIAAGQIEGVASLGSRSIQRASAVRMGVAE